MATINFINVHHLHYKSDSHSHKHWEIHYCLRKRGTILLDNGDEIGYEPNQIVLIPPDTIHTNTSDSMHGLISLSLMNWHPSHSKVCILSDNSNTELKHLLLMCHRFFHSTNPNSSALVSSILQVIVELIQDISGGKQLPLHVQQLENYIITNFSSTDFNMDNAIDKVGLCKDYASRLFLKHKGITLLQFLHHTRLTYAEKLLSSTTLTISEIATLCGFIDPLYFSRLFKKKLGVSPQNYTKTYKGD